MGQRLVKNKSTPENRAFWKSVEDITKEQRTKERNRLEMTVKDFILDTVKESVKINHIRLIKAIREKYGFGLKEAKMYISDLEDQGLILNIYKNDTEHSGTEYILAEVDKTKTKDLDYAEGYIALLEGNKIMGTGWGSGFFVMNKEEEITNSTGDRITKDSYFTWHCETWNITEGPRLEKEIIEEPEYKRPKTLLRWNRNG